MKKITISLLLGIIILVIIWGCTKENKPQKVTQTKGSVKQQVKQPTRGIIRTKQDDANNHYEQGRIYQRQGRLDDAIAEFQEAISIKPNYAEAHNNLGVTYQFQNRFDEAIAEFQQAISINPNYTQAQNNLKIAQLRLARKPKNRDSPQPLAK